MTTKSLTTKEINKLTTKEKTALIVKMQKRAVKGGGKNKLANWALSTLATIAPVYKTIDCENHSKEVDVMIKAVETKLRYISMVLGIDIGSDTKEYLKVIDRLKKGGDDASFSEPVTVRSTPMSMVADNIAIKLNYIAHHLGIDSGSTIESYVEAIRNHKANHGINEQIENVDQFRFRLVNIADVLNLSVKKAKTFDYLEAISNLKKHDSASGKVDDKYLKNLERISELYFSDKEKA